MVESFASSNGILLTSQLRAVRADERRLRQAAARGELVRVHRGAYVRADAWSALDHREQYRRRVIAAALASRSHPVLSHESAAAVWGIPIVGGDPSVVHVLTSSTAGTRTENGFRRHAATAGSDDIVEREDVRVTSLARTLIDLARSGSFPAAVAALDWSLRPPSKGAEPRMRIEALQEYFEGQAATHNRRRVHRALEFATPLAETPGESVSRAAIHELGFPAPVLQYRVDDARGLAGITDFAWPQHGLLGEFDGLIKYTRNLARLGENVEDIVVREKVREDRLRATGRRVARWLWSESLQPALLHDKLIAAGLPRSKSGPLRQIRAGAQARI
jgi:predicted transcriptional regulator of viral defense system